MTPSVHGKPRGRAFDAVFHIVMVGIASANLYILFIRAQQSQLIEQAHAEAWWSLIFALVWILPSAFYLREWASDATRTRLWARAPVVQYTGILVAAVGAVATLLRLLGATVVLLAQGGVAVAVDPPPGELTAGMVHGQLVWEAMDAVPLLNVTGAFGWHRPIVHPSWPIGIAAMTGRVAVSIFVLWTFKFLADHVNWSALPKPGSGEATNSPHE